MYQKVMIIGRLGRDVEVRYTTSGDAVASFSVATSEKYKDKGGNPQETTEWFNCTAFKRLGEVCGEYLSKGSLVMLEGKMRTTSYEKDGQTRYSTTLVVREMKMLDTRKEGGSYNSQASGGAPPSTQNGYDQDFEDDIPF